MNSKLPSLLLFLLLAMAADAKLTVFAAASTTETMQELAAIYEQDGGEAIRFNFAGSGTLARQIQAGAPADIFISANARWMDWLSEKNSIETATRFNLAENELVMIAPLGSEAVFGNSITGRIAVGDFKSVPAGMYAGEALDYMGWLEQYRPNLIMSSNVRTALLYVERGEVAAGIVYATDAKAAEKVTIIGTFPPEAHSLIVYPAAAVSQNKSTIAFLNFLKTDQAKTILKMKGFK